MVNKKYKVVLHIGLPKTATTTLQNNFFKAAPRRQDKFLGRAYTRLERKYFNPFEEIMRDLKKDLTPNEITHLTDKFHSMLSTDKVNVISEESLTVTADKKHETVYDNLKKITCDCDVSILIASRHPVDFFYSAYIEMYRWRYHSVKGKDTLAGFIDSFFEDLDSPEYDMFFFGRLLNKIKIRFEKIFHYSYEEFCTDKTGFLQIISDIFEVDYGDILFVNDLSKDNMRLKSHEGKNGEAVTLSQKIPLILSFFLGQHAKSRLREVKLLNSLYFAFLRAASRVKLTPNPKFSYLTESQREKLEDVFIEKMK